MAAIFLATYSSGEAEGADVVFVVRDTVTMPPGSSKIGRLFGVSTRFSPE